MKWKLAIANFLFLAPACMLLSQAIFLFSGVHPELKFAIVLGMSLFSFMQVGGLWMISWIPRRVVQRRFIMGALRVAGSFALVVPHPAAIVIGSMILGLSQAIFYRATRENVSQVWSNEHEQKAVYQLFGLSTNGAYLVLTPLGGILLGILSPFVISIVSSICSVAAVFIVGNYLAIEASPKKSEPTQQRKSSLSFSILADIFFLGSFVIPYGVMMAMIPLKVASAGLPSSFNGYLIGLNAAVVIITLLIPPVLYQMGSPFKRSENNLILFSSLSWCFLLLAVFFDIRSFELILIPWSLIEALQLPAIEHHIFSARSYDRVWIDRILLIDAVGSFLGPLIAAAIIGAGVS